LEQRRSRRPAGPERPGKSYGTPSRTRPHGCRSMRR